MMNALRIYYAAWLAYRLGHAVKEHGQATITYQNCRAMPHEYMARQRMLHTQRRATMLHEKTVRAFGRCRKPDGLFF